MNFNQIAKQTVDFQKTAFTNWYNTVAMIQDQSASAMEVLMSQTNLPMPEAARKAVKSWVNVYQGGFKSFYTYVESGFSSIEKNFVQGAKAAPAESSKLLAEEKKATPAKSSKPIVEEKKAAPAPKTSPAAK